jgi:hypothetical protein
MSINNIIELSSYDPNSKVNKSTDFEITSSNKVILNQGDVVSIKNVFLDARNFSTGALVFGEDVEIEIDFITYTMNSFNNDFCLYPNGGDMTSDTLSSFWDANTGVFNQKFSNQADVDGMPYILMCCPPQEQAGAINYSITANIASYVPYVKTFKYTLGAGTYTPQLIATTLTKALQRFQNNWLNYNGKKLIPNKYDFFVDLPKESVITNTSLVVGLNPQQNSNACFVNPIGYWSFVFGEGNSQGNCDYYRISNLQQDFNSTSPLVPANKHGMGYILANMISDYSINNNNNKSTQQQLIIYQSQRLIGTTELTLSYNDNGNGLFSFDNMHQPLKILQQGVFTPSIAYVNFRNHYYPDGTPQTNTAPASSNVPTGTPKVNDLYIIDRIGGICFTDLRSSLANFWEDYLGFGDVSRLCINPDLFRWNSTDKQFGISYGEFVLKTTSPYTGTDNILLNSFSTFDLTPSIDPGTAKVQYQSLINPNYQVYYPTNEVWTVYNTKSIINLYTITTDITNPIMATNPPQNALDCGHYLISIEGSYNTQLNNSQDTYQIKAICSKYFLNNDFVSGGFETSINYEHIGLPVILSKYKVKILNPSNKQPADLGKNNVIYLQIVKKPEQILNIQNVGSPDTDESNRQEAQVQSSSAK